MTFSTTGTFLAIRCRAPLRCSASYTCKSIHALSLGFANVGSIRVITRRMISAALPRGRALIAARSPKARSAGLSAALSG